MGGTIEPEFPGDCPIVTEYMSGRNVFENIAWMRAHIGGCDHCLRIVRYMKLIESEGGQDGRTDHQSASANLEG